MKILVTGGGGFVGSALIRRLDPRVEVVCIDRGRHYEALRRVFGQNVTLLQGDFADARLVGDAMRGVDALVHLGGVAGERRCTADPLKGMLSNVYATHVLLDAARREGVRRIVFASSYWVYSTFTARSLPISEDSELGTDSIYGAEKVVSERMIQGAGIPYAILRIAGVYGYGTGFGSQSEGMLGTFVLGALRDKPLPINGDGRQQIDLVYVEDLAAVIERLLEEPAGESGIYNVGGGRPVSVRGIAALVEAAFRRDLNRAVRLEFREAPPGKVWPDKWLAIDRIRRRVPEYPFTSLDSGIAATVRDFAKAIR